MTKLPDYLIDVFMSILIAEAVRRLSSFGYQKLKHFDFRKSFGWFKMFCHLWSFVIFANLGNRLEKAHLKPLSEFCSKVMLFNISDGIKTFSKTEPEAFSKISEVITQLDTDYKLYKITGLKTAFLQKYLPSLT